MSKYFLFLLAIVVGCNSKQDKAISKLINEHLDRSSKTIHKYTYDKSDRIILDNEISYDLINGIITDTTKATIKYSYDRNLLRKIETKSDIHSLSENELFFYDSKDSLTMELTINFKGDTTTQIKTTYDANGNKVEEFQTRLWDKTTLEELKENPSRIVYDTFVAKRENKFEDKLLISSIAKNKLGEVESENIYSYNAGHKMKMETFKFIGATKYPFSITTFNYSKYSKGEFETLDMEGSTKEFLSVELKDGRLFKKTFIGPSGDGFMQVYNNLGQVIYDIELRSQRVTSYTYDTKGNKEEIHSYKMRDSRTKRELDSLYRIGEKN